MFVREFPEMINEGLGGLALTGVAPQLEVQKEPKGRSEEAY